MKNIKNNEFNPIQTLVDLSFYLYRTIKNPRGDSHKLQAVIDSTHLRNLEGGAPTLTNYKPIPTGGQYTYRLPPGVSLKEWIDRKSYFETFLGGTVEIFPPTGPSLNLQVHYIDFPAEIPYTFDPPPDMLAPLPIGMAPDGEVLYTDLSELPHILVGGLPGFGKTVLLKGWTVALKLSNCEVFAIDRKRIDFPPLSPWINVAGSELEALALVQMLLKENDRRQTILVDHGVTRIQDLPPGTLPYMVLIVDEAAAIEEKETYEGIDSLTRLARATGISIILCTQKPSAKLWDGAFANTRDMCAGRVSLYVADYMMSQMILGKGNTAGARLPMTKGRAVSLLGDYERIVQTMFLPPDQAKSILTELDRGPYYQTITPAEQKPKPKRGRPKKNAN